MTNEQIIQAQGKMISALKSLVEEAIGALEGASLPNKAAVLSDKLDKLAATPLETLAR